MINIAKEVKEVYDAGSAYESRLLENLKISKGELNERTWRSIQLEFNDQLYEQWMMGIGNKPGSSQSEYEDVGEDEEESGSSYRTEKRGDEDVYPKFANGLRKATESREVSEILRCIHKYKDDFVNSGIDEETEGLLNYIESYLKPDTGKTIVEGDLVLDKLDVLVSKIEEYFDG